MNGSGSVKREEANKIRLDKKSFISFIRSVKQRKEKWRVVQYHLEVEPPSPSLPSAQPTLTDLLHPHSVTNFFSKFLFQFAFLSCAVSILTHFDFLISELGFLNSQLSGLKISSQTSLNLPTRIVASPFQPIVARMFFFSLFQFQFFFSFNVFPLHFNASWLDRSIENNNYCSEHVIKCA